MTDDNELEKHLRSGMAYIDGKNLDAHSKPEDGLVDHGDAIVVKAWPTRAEAAAFEASLPQDIREREANVRDTARDLRRGERFRLLMEQPFTVEDEPEVETRDRKVAIAAGIVLAVLAVRLIRRAHR